MVTDSIIIIKGAGEKASAIAHRLFEDGFKKIIMTERLHPTAERRGVCFSEALYEGKKDVCGVTGERTEPDTENVLRLWDLDNIAIFPDPHLEILKEIKPDVFIDAVMAKTNTGTTIRHAPLVIAIGPGFRAGRDAHFLVETNPNSPNLGRVLTEGETEANTGDPTVVSGLDKERLIISPDNGILKCTKDIGELVKKNEPIGFVDHSVLRAPIEGVIWGLMRGQLRVRADQKLGDIDPRGDRSLCFEITPQADAIAYGVLRAIGKGIFEAIDR